MSADPIDSISVKGFKSIASAKLELGPISVVIGPNGSGKSNLIGVFSFLHAVREGRLQDYVRRGGGAEQILHFGSRVTSEIVIEVSFEKKVNQYILGLRPSEDDSLYPAEETASFWDQQAHQFPYTDSLAARESGREAGISNPQVTKVALWVRSRLGGWRIYHVHDTSSSSPLRKTAKLDDNAFLRADGSNIAAFLYRLQQKNMESYQLIRRTIQRAAPFFGDFLLRPDPLNEGTIRLAWNHAGSDQYFGVSALSDGTLRFIALATLFLQPTDLRPSIIVVDEPELGLHPSAITLLASMIKQAAATTQVIVSTQSPLLLDHFQPQDVVVADRVHGATQFTRLDPVKLAGWLEDYSLGQLWEKNEFGGRPAPE